MSTGDRAPQVDAVGHVEVDQGLRAHMLRVYNYMSVGLLITAAVAYLTFAFAVTSEPTETPFKDAYLTGFGYLVFKSPLAWAILFSPLAFVFYFGSRVQTMTAAGARTAFFAFAGLVGLMLSSVFVEYTGDSIAQIFVITAASFGALSLWGYTTKRDLSPWGGFLFMGLIGLIIASVVNLFVGNSMADFVLSCIGVLIFAGFTAYDTQTIKEAYFAGDSSDEAGRKAAIGALELYLDFINLFLNLLNLFGDKD